MGFGQTAGAVIPGYKGDYGSLVVSLGCQLLPDDNAQIRARICASSSVGSAASAICKVMRCEWVYHVDSGDRESPLDLSKDRTKILKAPPTGRLSQLPRK